MFLALKSSRSTAIDGYLYAPEGGEARVDHESLAFWLQDLAVWDEEGTRLAPSDGEPYVFNVYRLYAQYTDGEPTLDGEPPGWQEPGIPVTPAP